MIKISKQNNSLIVEGIDNVFYPNNGDNSYPLNSLIVVTDNSDMATFRSVATNDVLFSGLINNITINGEVVTKDNIIEKFDAASNSSTGGGTVDAYTKEEADNKFASKDELANVQTVANDADTKADAATSRVESVETAMGNKQDTLVSGTNIKTVNSQSILGSGNIEVSGGIKTYEASEMPKKLNDALYQVVYEAYYTLDKYVTIDKSTDVEEFLSNLKTGDYLQVTEQILIQYYGIVSGNYKFAIKTGKEITDIHQYGRLITMQVISNMFFIKNNASGPVLQKNDLKTINGEEIVGSGNIEVSGVSEEQAQEIAKIPTLETEIAQKANVSDVPTVQTGEEGTNKNYIYSTPFVSNYGVYSDFIFNPNEEGIQMKSYYWGTHARAKLTQIPLVTTSKNGVMSAADKTKLDSMSNEWTGTQSEYDALTTKDDNTIYYVTE